MSISGISGVATKTSFALFFLRMLDLGAGIVGEGAANLRVLVFNVKGEDLLWLDTPNRFFDDEAAAGWAALGVEPGPVPERLLLGAAAEASGDVVLPDTGGRQQGVEVFTWTPREFIDEDLLQFLLTDANDQRNQLPFVRERVQAQLKRFAVDVIGDAGRGRAARPARRAGRAPGAARRSGSTQASGSSPTSRRSSTRSASSSSPRTATSPTTRGAAG